VSKELGFSGTIAKRFVDSELTPLLALVGLFLGALAIVMTPKEEEPQINVTFANILIPFPGASATEVEHLVATPAEQVLSEIEGVKHIYSVSEPGRTVLTVQYEVGERRTDAIVRLYEAVFSNQDWLPKNLGVGEPLIKVKGIDDVPIITLTLWTEDPARGGYELQKVAHAIEAELKRVKGSRDIYTVGGPENVVHVELDPVRLAAFDIATNDLRRTLVAANITARGGAVVKDNQHVAVQAGEFLGSVEEIERLIVGVRNEAPVYLRDVATVHLGPDQPEQYVWLGTGPAAAAKGIAANGEFPAVTIAVAKQPGTNAVEIAGEIIERFQQLKGVFIPEGVNVTVTRNYGLTADDKAKKLIGKLIFATGAVVLLVLIALGWREAAVVGTAIVVTLMLTLAASWAWGFTINRVSLFALIFSIGILVDDAIVVVENIHRHMKLGSRPLLEAIPLAVDEVGGPTILATFTVIGALLPMAFVSGLMGPYMSPIPINASFGMLISLMVAFVVTPWFAYKLFRRHRGGQEARAERVETDSGTLDRLLNAFVGPLLNGRQGAPRRFALFGGVLLLLLLALALLLVQAVVLKMLPFDNKSELQILVDLPEGTSVEQSARVLGELSAYLSTVPEVTDYQAYAGTSSPINFNGLVRQYYLRQSPELGDIQVNLLDKHMRDRQSHDIARDVRGPLRAIGAEYGANVKIVEVPPGPPVQAPLVAEIYGLDYAGQNRVAQAVRSVFEETPDVVDVDDSRVAAAPELIVRIDPQKAALLGIAEQAAVGAVQTVLSGEDVSFLHGGKVKYPIPIRLEFSVGNKADLASLLSLRLRSESGALIPLSEFASVVNSKREEAIYHKDLLPVAFVTGDMAGTLDSPLYALFQIRNKLKEVPVEGDYLLKQNLLRPPADPYNYSLKWDGEWQISYETFRDMGIAYAAGLALIYLLVVAQFRSYGVPLIIMAPIPLTVIGVLPGHALLGAQFTATSMIGMIALAGIIVRNSILLVDFINGEVRRGMPLEKAVIRSGAVRAKPIVLTGLAAMLGALFILDDPIFRGLAISLIFGILVSTLLTLVVIPVLYYAYTYRRRDAAAVHPMGSFHPPERPL
jgi:multidrug efflux pump subunit AcrB